MKTTEIRTPVMLGIDERIPAPPGTAAEFDNWRTDWQSGGWTTRLGYEKLFSGSSTFSPFVSMGRVDSVFLWSERSTALRWLLVESGGVLSLVGWNAGALLELQADRRQYALDEPRTTFVPTPQGLLVANGERLMRFNGWPINLFAASIPGDLLARAFVTHGYDAPPTAPRPYSVDAGADDFTTVLSSGRSSNAVANSSQDVGLGTKDNGDVILYQWRVSFVDQTGSESQVSSPSSGVSWTVAGAVRKVVPLDIPKGPPGTIARRLYRTAWNDSTYRLVVEIPNNVEDLYYDSVPDSQLGGAAPLDLTSMPAPTARFAALAAQCVFIDGGIENPQALFWSQPGTPSQFSLLDYAYLGGVGGDITGLAGYYNAVLVLRESQVDVVTGTYPDFRVAPLLTDAGGRAPHTAQAVPGYGLVFLADDGVYSLTGGLEGGSKAEVARLSDPIQGLIQRINPATVGAAVAVVCRRWKEYQLWVPIDGLERPSIGLIFHYDRGQWTTRTGWPVSSVTSTPEGQVLFGHQVGANGSNDLESGIFVMSGARQMGYEKPGEAFIPADPPTSVYLSRLDGAARPADKKHMRYVHLHQMAAGSALMGLTFEADRGAVANATAALASQPADGVLQPTYTAGLATETATWGTSTWQQTLPVDVRYSGVLEGASYMQFRLSTTNDVVVTGHDVGAVASATEVIEGQAARTRRAM